LLIYLTSKLRRLTALQIRVLVTFVCIAAMIATPLLTTIKNNGNNSYNNYNQLFLQQAFAHHMETATSNETTILHQGIVASQPSHDPMC
jgi:hypothetical protein